MVNLRERMGWALSSRKCLGTAAIVADLFRTAQSISHKHQDFMTRAGMGM